MRTAQTKKGGHAAPKNDVSAFRYFASLQASYLHERSLRYNAYAMSEHGDCRNVGIGCLPHRADGFKKLLHESIIRPSSESVTTCQGMNLPDSCNAFFAAISRPPQHGTSMRTIVTDLTSFSRRISASFSE